MTSQHATTATNDRLLPAFLVHGLPADLEAAAAALGLTLAVFGPMRGGAWQADFDLPRGTSWRLLPDKRAALWMARDAAAATPPVPGSWSGVDIDLVQALWRLARAGLWLTEASLLIGSDAWTARAPGGEILRRLADESAPRAVAGVWSDPHGRAVQAELHHDGRIWAENHIRAERLLLVAAGLEE
jgi:hypothetical protein